MKAPAEKSCSEMARGGAEAHRGSALTTEGTRELIPGAIGRAMKRIVLRDNEARAKGFISPVFYWCSNGSYVF